MGHTILHASGYIFIGIFIVLARLMPILSVPLIALTSIIYYFLIVVVAKYAWVMLVRSNITAWQAIKTAARLLWHNFITYTTYHLVVTATKITIVGAILLFWNMASGVTMHYTAPACLFLELITDIVILYIAIVNLIAPPLFVHQINGQK